MRVTSNMFITGARTSTNCSDHHIQLERPEVVVAAVNEVVASVRHSRPVNRQSIAAKRD
jgi:hypothetical protein